MYSAFWEVTHGRLPKGKLLSTKSPNGFSLLRCSSTGPSTNSRCALPHSAGGGALQTKALPFVPGFLLHPKIPQGITPMRKRRPVTGFHRKRLPMLASSAHGEPHASRAHPSMLLPWGYISNRGLGGRMQNRSVLLQDFLTAFHYFN